MNSVLNYFLFFTPSFINKIIRRLLGQKIGKKVRIRFGTLLIASDVIIDDNVVLGPLSIIKAKNIRIGSYSRVKSLCIINTHTIDLRKHTHIAPLAIINGNQSKKSSILIDDHSRIFPFCWIDCGHGVEIGKNVGVGGHSLIFTHGVWPNYLDGSSVSFGKVTIEDNVWIPWRVFILPNTHIGKNSIVGGNSLLNKSYPPNSLIAGSPAKILKENIQHDINSEERINRFSEIIKDYIEYYEIKQEYKNEARFMLEDLFFSIDSSENIPKGGILICLNQPIDELKIEQLINNGVHVIDHINKTLYRATKSKKVDRFVSFLRRYGVRFYIKNNYGHSIKS